MRKYEQILVLFDCFQSNVLEPKKAKSLSFHTYRILTLCHRNIDKLAVTEIIGATHVGTVRI